MDRRQARARWRWQEFLDDAEKMEMLQLRVQAEALDRERQDLRAKMNRIRNRGTQRAKAAGAEQPKEAINE